MNTSTISSPALRTPLSNPAADRAPAAAERVLRLLQRLPRGQLDLTLPDGRAACLRGLDPGHRATMHAHDWEVFDRTRKTGDIGLAECYVEGKWDSADLPSLLRLGLLNRDHIEGLLYGRWWGRLAHRVRHLLHRNTRAGSEKNIHAHYDLGNPFYRLWLDAGMSYSAAWFEGQAPAGVDLQAAQNAKMRRALREAGVSAGSHLLEIGCGWGGLAEMAAGEWGARVTGVTLSKEQLHWGQERLRARGLCGQAELRLQDYRDLPARHAREPFDAIVSIEMFEAVGREFWRGWFDTVRACLKPGGRACIQTITIRDDLFARYLRSSDFIQQYIFPGGLLPSPSAFEAEARRAGLVVENRLAFGADYAETLRRWRAAFGREKDAVARLGFDARFLRIWDFYLSYCEAAFDTGNTDVIQFTLRKP